MSRQKSKCASCGTRISDIGMSGQTSHKFGEGAHAHHRKPINMGGTKFVGNCVIICEACHYSAHAGGNYQAKFYGKKIDYPYFNG